jgi:hypothetical protein
MVAARAGLKLIQNRYSITSGQKLYCLRPVWDARHVVGTVRWRARIGQDEWQSSAQRNRRELAAARCHRADASAISASPRLGREPTNSG